MRMNQRDIYKELQLDYLWGDAFEIEIGDQDISTEDKRIALLDKVCTLKDLKQLGAAWNKIDFEKAKDLLLKSLRYDLAYSSVEIAPLEKAVFLQKEIIQDFDGLSHCYSNWSGSPWGDNGGGTGWDPLTENTFDLGIILINNSKMTFILHISED
jgi:hypothetical protein